MDWSSKRVFWDNQKTFGVEQECMQGSGPDKNSTFSPVTHLFRELVGHLHVFVLKRVLHFFLVVRQRWESRVLSSALFAKSFMNIKR